jgi:hypothetical protein
MCLCGAASLCLGASNKSHVVVLRCFFSTSTTHAQANKIVQRSTCLCVLNFRRSSVLLFVCGDWFHFHALEAPATAIGFEFVSRNVGTILHSWFDMAEFVCERIAYRHTKYMAGHGLRLSYLVDCDVGDEPRRGLVEGASGQHDYRHFPRLMGLASF